jgi:hypothetical protein
MGAASQNQANQWWRATFGYSPMKPWISFAAAILIGHPALSEVLYNIGFDTPDQAVNQVVRTGPAPQHVSGIVFGTPTVVPSFGALSHQPLMFNSNGQSPLGLGGYYYTQIQLNLNGAQPPILDLSFDFTDLGAGHEFIVLFDTPECCNFQFYAGQITFDPATAPSVAIGSYSLGHADGFDIRIDHQLNRWSFYEDGTFLAQGALNQAGYVQDIRFNYSAFGPDISGTAIDNLAVTIPEPAQLASVACVIGALMFHARRG